MMGYIIALAVFFLLVFFCLRDLLGVFGGNIPQVNRHFRELKPDDFGRQWSGFLRQFHLYFRNLDDAGAERFLSRLKKLAEQILIIPKEGLALTDEIRIILLADLVQLTYGLN